MPADIPARFGVLLRSLRKRRGWTSGRSGRLLGTTADLRLGFGARIVGTCPRVSAKHQQAYLDEMCFRFDNRKNPYLFRDTASQDARSAAC
jgi:hypothetical protein